MTQKQYSNVLFMTVIYAVIMLMVITINSIDCGDDVNMVDNMMIIIQSQRVRRSNQTNFIDSNHDDIEINDKIGNGNNNIRYNDEEPCDTTVNQCMDWCGEIVRRRGKCPNGQMCCVLIY